MIIIIISSVEELRELSRRSSAPDVHLFLYHYHKHLMDYWGSELNERVS